MNTLVLITLALIASHAAAVVVGALVYRKHYAKAQELERVARG